MGIKLRVYLDTSVISAKIDPRDAGRQQLTELFWDRLPSLDAVISPTVLREIDDTPDESLRRDLRTIAATFVVLDDHPEIESLVGAYVRQEIFSKGQLTDARHVATAVLASVPVLASWNFKHLVNRSRRIRVNLVNAARGLGQIEIVSPPEIQ